MASVVSRNDAVETTPDLMFLLAWANHALATEQTSKLAQVGISPRAYCVLSKAMVTDLTQIRLAEVCGLDKTTIVVAVDELEAAGLAYRRASATDRRVRIITVTNAGRRAVARAQKIVAGIDQDILSTLPDDERVAFVAGLKRLVAGRLSTPVPCDRSVRRRSPRMR